MKTQKTGKRKNARAWAMKLLFQYSFTNESPEALINSAESIEEIGEYASDPYLTDIIEKTINNVESIDEAIASCAKGWERNRISKMTMTIMRLSVAEMRYRNDIPMSISINEAIELAKEYDNENAPPFINGVLHALAKKEELQ